MKPINGLGKPSPFSHSGHLSGEVRRECYRRGAWDVKTPECGTINSERGNEGKIVFRSLVQRSALRVQRFFYNVFRNSTGHLVPPVGDGAGADDPRTGAWSCGGPWIWMRQVWADGQAFAQKKRRPPLKTDRRASALPWVLLAFKSIEDSQRGLAVGWAAVCRGRRSASGRVTTDGHAPAVAGARSGRWSDGRRWCYS